MNNLICIAGPTASGKTALSIALAKELGAEIVSCDSMQVYQYMDIGTAKPTLEEREGIIHHMLDVARPDEDFSVSRYCAMADPIVEDIPTIQYRWVRNKYREPMVVPDVEMERFIHAVNVSAAPRFYLPEEITPAMANRRIRIVGGPMDGYEGTLVTVRGSRVKRLLVEIPNVLAVAVEVSPELIQLI